MDPEFRLPENIQKQPEGLELLDRVEPVPEDSIPNDVAVDILKAAAEVGKEEASLFNNAESKESPPTTFNEMLDTSMGKFWQRVTKTYIKPRNPERTIRLMKALQVDHFLKLVKKLRKKKQGIEQHQENYFLIDSSLNSMLTLATKGTVFNEKLHLALAAGIAAVTLPVVVSGQIEPILGVNLSVFLLQTYLVLGQRYNRARLSIAIDKALKRHKEFDVNNFRNSLNLRLPE